MRKTRAVELQLYASGRTTARDDLGLSEDVPADAIDALDDDAVGRVDADERRRVVDDLAAVETATQRVGGEHSLVGHVVDVAARLAVDQATTHRLRERHRPPQQLQQSAAAAAASSASSSSTRE